MKKRVLNVMFSKSGSGSISPRLSLPKTFLEKLKITKEERAVEVVLDEKNQKIIISKKGE